jgi:hypothetical protein
MPCYSCDNEITKDNVSSEHIINNSIGGRIQSTELLCSDCNVKFSNTIDSKIEGQLGHLADLLGVKKDRPKNNVKIPLRTAKGEIKFVGRKMTPHDEIKVDIEGVRKFELTAETPERYEQLKKEKTEQLSKKFKVKYEETTKMPDGEKYFIGNSNSEKPGIIGFGGYDYFRGLAKIALNYYLSRGYQRSSIPAVVDFINGTSKDGNIVNYYYPSHYEIHDLKEGEVTHIIHVVGDSECKVLFVYLELFNFENVIVVLDRDYKGKPICDTYCYDLLAGKKIEKSMEIKLGCHHFEFLPIIARGHRSEHERKFHRFEKIIENRQQD